MEQFIKVKSSKMVEIFETPLLSCWFGDDGILYSESKVAERSMENYQLLFELYKTLSNNGNKKLRTLGNITKTQHSKKEVREYIAKELPKYIKAMALISDSSMGKMIGNVFIKLNPPPYPIRFFNNSESAVKWLKNLNT